MIATKIAINKQYTKECAKLFIKHRTTFLCFIILVLTTASALFLFGESCYLEFLKFTPIPFVFDEKHIKTNALQKSDEDMSTFQKKQFKLDMQTRALQRRLRELTVRSGIGGHFLTENQVKYMITEALRIYDSDKLGLRDYALESAGGSIISTPSTSPVKLSKEYVFLTYFTVPVYSNPREIIRPQINPGNCFTFEGFQGKIRIKLANKINIRGVTLENPSIDLLTEDEILSIPKIFQVIGLQNGDSKDGILLGEFAYELEGPAMQHFVIENNENNPSFQFVELYILDNHRHYKYTSVYRFRVHGVPWWH